MDDTWDERERDGALPHTLNRIAADANPDWSYDEPCASGLHVWIAVRERNGVARAAICRDCHATVWRQW